MGWQMPVGVFGLDCVWCDSGMLQSADDCMESCLSFVGCGSAWKASPLAAAASGGAATGCCVQPEQRVLLRMAAGWLAAGAHKPRRLSASLGVKHLVPRVPEQRLLQALLVQRMAWREGLVGREG